MTTEQAALLAALEETLRLFPAMLFTFLTLALGNGWRHLDHTVAVLPTQLMYVVWGAALPVFFFTSVRLKVEQIQLVAGIA
jgi:hypothetical protein